MKPFIIDYPNSVAFMKRVGRIFFFSLALNVHYGYSTPSLLKEFRFINQQGDILHGNLIMPELNESTKIPVVIFLVGSAQSAFDKNYKHFGKENLEDLFLKKGIGICYFNKPGIGLSTGKWYKQSFYDRANDVKSCIDFLQTLPGIDISKVGVIGHSQGGWVAQIAVVQFPKDIRFGISLAGPSYNVKNQLITDFASTLICKGVPKSKAIKKAKLKTGFVFALAGILPLNKNLKQLQKIKNYTPEKNIRNISQPFSFMFGQNDRLVYYDWCIDAINKIYNKVIPKNIDIHIIKDANHGFEIAPFCSDTKIKTDYSKDFQDELVHFVETNVK